MLDEEGLSEARGGGNRAVAARTPETGARGLAAGRLRERACRVLRVAADLPHQALAAQLGLTAPKVGCGRRRVVADGAGSMAQERPCGAHPGGQDSRPPAQQRGEVFKVPTRTPPAGRALARHLWTPRSFVPRVGRAPGLQPHRIRTFPLSPAPGCALGAGSVA